MQKTVINGALLILAGLFFSLLTVLMGESDITGGIFVILLGTCAIISGFCRKSKMCLTNQKKTAKICHNTYFYFNKKKNRERKPA
ncbi:hypothetical protein NBH08_27845 [Faecalicatena sp. BF-R-105]|nr:hypothetical protein [Faecalicatena sp. BF-R-105]